MFVCAPVGVLVRTYVLSCVRSRAYMCVCQIRGHSVYTPYTSQCGFRVLMGNDRFTFQLFIYIFKIKNIIQ